MKAVDANTCICITALWNVAPCGLVDMY